MYSLACTFKCESCRPVCTTSLFMKIDKVWFELNLMKNIGCFQLITPKMKLSWQLPILNFRLVVSEMKHVDWQTDMAYILGVHLTYSCNKHVTFWWMSCVHSSIKIWRLLLSNMPWRHIRGMETKLHAPVILHTVKEPGSGGWPDLSQYESWGKDKNLCPCPELISSSPSCSWSFYW
jgi:hypothetical protein